MSTRAGAALESEAGRFGTSAEEAVTAPVFRKVVPGVCCARSSNWHERHSGDANCTRRTFYRGRVSQISHAL